MKPSSFLSRLRRLVSRRRIRVVQQMTYTECGPACLAMVLAYHGKTTAIDQIRDLIAGGRDGTTAVQIIEASEQLGLRGRGVRVDVDSIETVGKAAILHWDFSHFVVFDRRRSDHIYIIDPALGRRRVSLDEFRKSFTGVAIVFEPIAGFSKKKESTKHWSRRYVRQVFDQKYNLVRIVVFSILVQAFGLVLPVLTAELIDKVIPAVDVSAIRIIFLAIGFAGVFFFAVNAVRSILLTELSTILDHRTTLSFLGHLMELPFGFFQQRSAGDLMARLRSNAVLREALTSSVLSGVLDGAMVIAYFIAILCFSWRLGFCVFAIALFELLVLTGTRTRHQELVAENLAKEGQSQAFQIEMLGGVQTLKAMGCEQSAVRHWTTLFVDVLNTSVAQGRLEAFTDAIASTTRFISPLILLCVGGEIVIRNAMTLGQMLAAVGLAVGFLIPMSNLLQTLGQLQRLESYLERLEDVYRTEREQPVGRDYPSPDLGGQIALENVQFRFTRTSPLVLNHISLVIRPGEQIAIVGMSGAGKSTLALLLVGLYPPTSGRILFDGLDLHSLNLRSVRRQIGFVPHDPAFFGDSIRNNITMAEPDCTMEDIVQAAQIACFHEDVEKMKMGYETFLIDRGSSLSGGQRQRLALARALVRKPRILVLDEATSSLDTITESAIQAALSELDCTRIIIAHRLSTVINADRIIVLNEGAIVQQGRHAELMAQPGFYANLVAAQERQVQSSSVSIAPLTRKFGEY